MINPAVAWRVGVTGSRVLSPEALAPLRGHIHHVLSLICDEVSHYSLTTQAPTFRLLSPLAEGADRLVAETALPLGYVLESPLPFTQTDYETDFPATAPEFRALLAQAAHKLELDGGRGDDENRSYESVGRHVVRNSDLLIAIWNGRPAQGRGGTGDIVRFAIRSGVPVWWLPSNGTEPPRLLRTPRELREPHRAPVADTAERAVRELLRRAILPPWEPPPHPHTVIGRIVQSCLRLFRQRTSPLNDYLHESAAPPAGIWRTYARFMNWITSHPPCATTAMLPPQGSIETYWHNLYTPADTLSQAYGDRYRSSYLIIFALAFIAVICAVFGLAFHPVAMPFTWIEMLVLAMIAGLVVGNHVLRWHDRWISYRLLSELCRKQQVLAPLGWSLPNWEVDRLATSDATDPHATAAQRDAWIAWYFTAARRAAPLPSGALATATLQRARDVGRALMQEQNSYHAMRRFRSNEAARRLGNLGDWFFILTLIGVAAKLALLGTDAERMTISLVGILCALLPAASAGFVGIRAYAEFELLAHQSARMQAAMQAALAELDTLQLDRPLASQDLGAEFYEVATSMLQDISGWAQLFRLKVVETG